LSRVSNVSVLIDGRSQQACFDRAQPSSPAAVPCFLPSAVPGVSARAQLLGRGLVQGPPLLLWISDWALPMQRVRAAGCRELLQRVHVHWRLQCLRGCLHGCRRGCLCRCPQYLRRCLRAGFKASPMCLHPQIAHVHFLALPNPFVPRHFLATGFTSSMQARAGLAPAGTELGTQPRLAAPAQAASATDQGLGTLGAVRRSAPSSACTARAAYSAPTLAVVTISPDGALGPRQPQGEALLQCAAMCSSAQKCAEVCMRGAACTCLLGCGGLMMYCVQSCVERVLGVCWCGRCEEALHIRRAVGCALVFGRGRLCVLTNSH
jgi:hypothetical protein